jgi:hypothetical protein
LMDKLQEAARRLEVLEAAVPDGQRPVLERLVPPAPPPPTLPGIDPLAATASTLVVLIFAHFQIIVEHNLPLLLLRIASILVPVVFGFFCRESTRRNLIPEFLYGMVVALLAILAMSTIVSRLDHVPAMPRNWYEWREFVEYGASITFGFFTGVVCRHTVIAMRSSGEAQNRLIAVLARAISDKLGGEAAGFNMRTVQSLVSAAIAAGSAIASLVTGLRLFF